MGTLRKAVIGKWMVAALLAAAFGLAQARSAEDEALDGAVADGVTTAVGLAAGAVELNPLGPVLGIGMKVVLFQYAKSLPESERPRVYAAAASLWQGAAANNLCVAASLLSGGSFAPVCLAVGVAWGVKKWRDTAPEREFQEACATLREYAHEPELTCVYAPLDQAAAPAVPGQPLLSAQASQTP